MLRNIFKKRWIPIMQKTDEKYYLELDKEFVAQFPSRVNRYLAVDTKGEGVYYLTSTVYEKEPYGMMTVMDRETAIAIQLKLHKVPLELKRYKKGEK